MARLGGKTAFVTGAASGIGRAIAFALASEGAKVALVDVNEKLLEEAMKEGEGLDLIPILCDVSDRSAVHAKLGWFANKAGGLDILVNNAVSYHFAPLVDFEPDIIDKLLGVGLKGTYWTLQAATPHLIARGGGSIINLSSATVYVAFANNSIYTSIKGAIDALTRQQAAELAQHNIRVNALAPGSVITQGTRSVIDEKGWQRRKEKSLLKRLVTAEEVAKAAIFLACNDSLNVTGVTLKIDGGMTVAGP